MATATARVEGGAESEPQLKAQDFALALGYKQLSPERQAAFAKDNANFAERIQRTLKIMDDPTQGIPADMLGATQERIQGQLKKMEDLQAKETREEVKSKREIDINGLKSSIAFIESRKPAKLSAEQQAEVTRYFDEKDQQRATQESSAKLGEELKKFQADRAAQAPSQAQAEVIDFKVAQEAKRAREDAARTTTLEKAKQEDAEAKRAKISADLDALEKQIEADQENLAALAKKHEEAKLPVAKQEDWGSHFPESPQQQVATQAKEENWGSHFPEPTPQAKAADLMPAEVDIDVSDLAPAPKAEKKPATAFWGSPEEVTAHEAAPAPKDEKYLSADVESDAPEVLWVKRDGALVPGIIRGSGRTDGKDYLAVVPIDEWNSAKDDSDYKYSHESQEELLSWQREGLAAMKPDERAQFLKNKVEKLDADWNAWKSGRRPLALKNSRRIFTALYNEQQSLLDDAAIARMEGEGGGQAQGLAPKEVAHADEPAVVGADIEGLNGPEITPLAEPMGVLTPEQALEKYMQFEGGKRDKKWETSAREEAWKDSADDAEVNRRFLKTALELQPQYGEEALEQAKTLVKDQLLLREMTSMVQDSEGIFSEKERKQAYAYLQERLPRTEPKVPSATELAAGTGPKIMTPEQEREEMENAWQKSEPKELNPLATSEKLGEKELAASKREAEIALANKEGVKKEKFTITKEEQEQIAKLPAKKSEGTLSAARLKVVERQAERATQAAEAQAKIDVAEGKRVKAEVEKGVITQEQSEELRKELAKIPKAMFPWAKRFVTAAVMMFGAASDANEMPPLPEPVANATAENISMAPVAPKVREISVTVDDEAATTKFKPAEREFADQVVSAMKAEGIDVNARDVGRIYGEAVAQAALGGSADVGSAMRRELKNVVQSETMGKIKAELRKAGKDVSDDAVIEAFKKYMTILAPRWVSGNAVSEKETRDAMQAAAQEM